MKRRLFFIPKVVIICLPQVQPGGSQILPVSLFPKRFLGSGNQWEIHAGEQRMKTKSVLAPRVLRFFPLQAKRTNSSILATDGFRIILQKADIYGCQLNGKKEIR